jgi:hypothetical protein
LNKLENLTEVDYCLPKSRYEEVLEFMNGIYTKERELATICGGQRVFTSE